MSNNADIALIGLAVMGQNLVLNMADNGYTVVTYNRTHQKAIDFLEGPAAGKSISISDTLEDLVSQLKSPRKIMLMVKAGAPVDSTIDALLPLLNKGDIIIDGGNSNFVDTQRRALDLKDKGILFVGSGVSGGEEGARFGPSLMPGGHADSWPHIKNLFQAIAAKTDSGVPCCDWVGDNGAGHFVKMVHNGIEYGDMQLICEAYQYMKDVLGMDNQAMHSTFAQWNTGNLNSYLIEITADILAYQENGTYVVDTIVDKAGQKGTGKWTAINALDLGIPLTLIGEAVLARFLSALKDERVKASGILPKPAAPSNMSDTDKAQALEALGHALFASKIISYTQGYMLMRAAAEHYNWTLNFGGIAQMWRGGCIIRSAFLDDIKNAFDKEPKLSNLLLDDYFRNHIEHAQAAWRSTIANGVKAGIPMPAMSSALAFFDGYRSERLPANLLQAQRDYFGAHTYQILGGDGAAHHTDWTGTGGDVSSTTYNA
ncbi:MAG: decarboxylating NADP(+)-dependent phosphogluconate dehydrogenase [Gammaproteobacteria bacterium]|nr:decarboxylating NADP(+)-dependent phosphogluconate dehydrogenase [Gammaproteobacteria bacterium]